jgi:peptidylamidoglycolate lyase
MKSYRRILAVPLFLAIGFGLTWAVAKYVATPPARGERVWEGEELALEFIPSQTVLVLDAETGDLLGSWGADMFVMPHGLTIDHEDNLWLTDVGLHQVFKFDRAGNLLMVLGERGVAGEDSAHFNMPTDVAVAPDGSFYASDGYRNSRVIKFSAQGDYITSWGSFGTGAGEFDVPHSLALDSQGHVYVADRGNARLQIFEEAGQFITEWKGKSLGRPWAVRISATGDLFIIDGGDQAEFWPDRARILKLDPEGEILASFGSYGEAPGKFVWPHAIALGSDDTLYVGEVSTGMRIQKFMK